MSEIQDIPLRSVGAASMARVIFFGVRRATYSPSASLNRRFRDFLQRRAMRSASLKIKR